MVSRRDFILGTGLLGLGGAGGWLAATGQLSDVLNGIGEMVPGGSLEVGDTAEFGELDITATDVRLTGSLTLGKGRTSVNWEAPDGGVIALWRLKAENTDIESHEAPWFNARNHDDLTEEENVISATGVNDIRVYGDNEGASLSNNRAFIYADQFTVAGRTLPIWPTGAAAPEIGPNNTLVGWVCGLIEVDQTPALRIRTKNQDVRWEAGDSAQEITPSQNTTVEF